VSVGLQARIFGALFFAGLGLLFFSLGRKALRTGEAVVRGDAWGRTTQPVM
jgi:hypothetical protein